MKREVEISHSPIQALSRVLYVVFIQKIIVVLVAISLVWDLILSNSGINAIWKAPALIFRVLLRKLILRRGSGRRGGRNAFSPSDSNLSPCLEPSSFWSQKAYRNEGELGSAGGVPIQSWGGILSHPLRAWGLMQEKP